MEKANFLKKKLFAKIIPQHKIRNLWKFGGIKVTGSATNMALFQGGSL